MATDYELVPDSDLELSSDDELDSALGGEEVEESLETEATPLPYGRTWVFDFNTNRFVRYGSAPAEAWGKDALRMWCMTALHTMRGAHPILDDEFGIEDPYSLIGHPDSAENQSIWESDVRDALLQHDRILDVTDFVFEHNELADYLDVSFVIVTDDEDRVEFALPGGDEA